MHVANLRHVKHTLPAADFIYVDFNDTTGISFVGDAATTSCDDGLPVRR